MPNATLNEVNPTIVARLSALLQRLAALRPLTGVALEKLNRWYDVELTYTSNALEGNTLNFRETALVIEKGITIGGKTINEHLEVVDHYNAVQAMRKIASSGRPVTERDVLDLHAIVVRRSNPTIAGMYATEARRISGSRVILPSARKVPGLMEVYGHKLQQSETWLDALEAHYDLVTIHPFADGNGRTARLLMNLLLLRQGFPPVSIGPEVRNEYNTVLEDRQLAEPIGHPVENYGPRSAYIQFMADRLMASTKRYLQHLEPEVTPPARSAGRGGVEF